MASQPENKTKERPKRITYRRNKQSGGNPDSLDELVKLFKIFSKSSYKPVKKEENRAQKCVTKMQYSSNIDAHKKQLNDYLTREGTGKDGEEAVLFGSDHNEYKENMEARNFRIFLSPESDKIDLKEMTKEFIKCLEMQTGYKLLWQGACHYNTAHPHSHILINGSDKDGKEVKFSKDVVKTFMRETARDICTKQVGLRTDRDLALDKEKELVSSRFTKLDEKILGLCNDQNRIFPIDLLSESARIKKRLETLKALKLCEYKDHGYIMRKNWDKDLKANSKYNTFLRAREELKFTEPSQLQVYAGKEGSAITGKVTKIYRTDGDASNNHAVILESLDGKAHFIPLLNEPVMRDKGNKTNLKEGELITLITQKTQKGRLTPFIFKKDLRSAQKEIKNNEFDSRLAGELLKAKPPVRILGINIKRGLYEDQTR